MCEPHPCNHRQTRVGNANFHSLGRTLRSIATITSKGMITCAFLDQFGLGLGFGFAHEGLDGAVRTRMGLDRLMEKVMVELPLLPMEWGHILPFGPSCRCGRPSGTAPRRRLATIPSLSVQQLYYYVHHVHGVR